ncbi:MAG: ribonuclease HII [Rhodospirillales bacterium]|jgi:ribonuclease HII|nr:ribonuclease HII [Rhodospirillales bacterium]MDP6882523.1 ribonuclease HII [Rhodospirillales bacterium]
MPDFSLESRAARAGRTVVAGIDEAGRGPWAGPVVAAAVVLDVATVASDLLDGLDDSKRLSAARRETLFAAMRREAGVAIGIGRATVAEIGRLNILGATLAAMTRAVADLGSPLDLALVDGKQAPALPCAVECVVGGDGRSLSIAAASIAAKVTRDRIMAGLAQEHPGYGWERNAGYGTAEHRDALERLGVTPHHRRGFKPIIKILGLDSR